MSRVIKFRAWEPPESMWPADLFYLREDEGGIYIVTKTGHGARRNVTLTQFTGLHDKNGVEIYEGDVVTIGAGDGCSVRTIIFGEGSFCIDVAGCSLGVFAHIACVIGNIYANPELLEGNDNAGDAIDGGGV